MGELSALRREVHEALAAWRTASTAEMPRDTLVGWLSAIQTAELRYRAAREALRAALVEKRRAELRGGHRG